MQIRTDQYSISYQGYQTRPLSENGIREDSGNDTSRTLVNGSAPVDSGLNPPSSDTQPQTASSDSQAQPDATNPAATETGLTQAELKLVSELKQADSEVKRHEMAHLAAAGGLALSGANFTFRRGPDGINYAVAGEVSIDVAPVPGDPQATIQKMQKVKNAALAPANPSSQDVKVASKATSMAAKASADLMIQRAEEQARAREQTAFGNVKEASDTYIRIRDLPEQDSSFQLAV